MDHMTAIKANAAEQYLLGELSAADVDAFEEHYFECALCTEDLRAGMSLMDGGRRLVRETAAAPEPLAPVVPIESRPRWNKWIPAAAAAALMAIPINLALLIRMQNVVPRVVQVAAAPDPGKALGTGQFLDVAVRDGEEQVVTADTIYFNVTAEPLYENYEVQILDAAGKVVSKGKHPRRVVETQPLSADMRALQAGSYQLVISGTEPAGQSTEISRTGFVVKREKQRGQLQQRGPRRQPWNSHTTQAPARQAA